MITRTQAEALLTLAESLEACERLGVDLFPGESGCGDGVISYGPTTRDEAEVPNFKAMSIRLAVNALIPKQET